MWEFYYAPETISLASHIALLDAGVDLRLRQLDFGSSEQQSEEYLRLNPKARVPTLVTEDGQLTETPAILAYIAQSFPEARLAPMNNVYAFACIQDFAVISPPRCMSLMHSGCVDTAG